VKKDPAAPHARRGPLQQGRPSSTTPSPEPGAVTGEPIGLPPAPAGPGGSPPGRRRFAIDTSPLRERPFRRLWTGQTITVVGTQMTLVVVPFQVFSVTHSSLAVGLTSIVALVPLVVFGLLGGAIADAVDRRVLLLGTQSGAALASGLLFAQSLLPGPGHLWVLWTLTAVESALTAVNSPTRSASIPTLVGDGNVAAANALNTTVQQAGVIVGPLLAGFLIDAGGLPVTYAIDAAGFVVAVILLRGLPPLPPVGAEGRLRFVAALRSVGEGFAFLRTQPVLLMTFVVDLIAMFFGWPRAVIPELAQTTFAHSANALGWLSAGVSIGALLMGLVSGWVTRIDRQGATVLSAICIWGVAVALFGLSHSLVLAVFFLAVAGAGDLVSSVLRTSMLQTAAPDNMRGRMQGVFIVVVAGGPRLGDLRAGALAAGIGIPATMVSGGIAIVVAMAVVALAVPSFRRFRASQVRSAP
jgi:MFS family permease